jgi:hypothetical protein
MEQHRSAGSTAPSQHPVVGAGHAGAHALDLLEIEPGGNVADLVLGLR